MNVCFCVPTQYETGANKLNKKYPVTPHFRKNVRKSGNCLQNPLECARNPESFSGASQHNLIFDTMWWRAFQVFRALDELHTYPAKSEQSRLRKSLGSPESARLTFKMV